MIRPISLFLLLMIVLAGRKTADGMQLSELGLLICLCIVPLCAIVAMRFEKYTKVVPLYATFILLLSLYLAIENFGWKFFLEKQFGTNELLIGSLILLPTILWLLILWWISSPIANRLSWVSHRLRLDVLLLLIPVFLFFMVEEIATGLNFGEDVRSVVELGAFLLLLAFMPFLMTFILSAKQMENYSLRTAIMEVAARARIRNSKVYVWNTHNRIMNAFATGLILQPKLVVLTDKLITRLTPRELLAVTAHEYAHHKYLHTTFLVLTAFVSMRAMSIVFPLLGASNSNNSVQVVQLVLTILAIILVSRQFERQADAYSALEMSKNSDGEITEEGGSALADALGAIAFAQSIKPTVFDLLHGSIASRQQYLLGIIGSKYSAIAVNKRVFWLKLGLAIILVGTFFL